MRARATRALSVLSLLLLAHCGGSGSSSKSGDAGPCTGSSCAPCPGDSCTGDGGPPPGCTDSDGDGAGIGSECDVVDCDDTRADVHPGAIELCDGVDDDCSGTADESCVCPLLTYDCPAGCCDLDSEQVSEGYSRYPAVDLDEDGNLYVAYANPSSGTWGTGVSIHHAATSQWDYQTFTYGSVKTNLIVSPTGRIHHQYANGSGTVYYHYSDDGGTTWQDFGTISGSLRIGGACSMAIDESDAPHLYCGMVDGAPDSGKPTYIRWTGSEWDKQVLDLDDASTYDDAQLRLGYQERPSIVYTYGPDDVDLHYSYFTGVQWETEPVPFPDGLTVHPDFNPGFALDAAGTAHIAFSASNDGSYEVWYGQRTANGEWSFERVLDETQLGDASFANVYLALTHDGQPVVFTSLGSGGKRVGADDWQHYTTGRPVSAMTLWAGRAYLIFPTDTGGMQLRLDIVEL